MGETEKTYPNHVALLALILTGTGFNQQDPCADEWYQIASSLIGIDADVIKKHIEEKQAEGTFRILINQIL